MKEIDQKIRAALRGTTAGDALAEEPNLAEELVTAFRGRNHWTNLLAVVFSLGGFGLAVWAGWRFYGAENVSEQLRWGGLALVAVLFVSFIKVWFWLEMHSNRILREVKRVELLLLNRETGGRE